jgi:hypothetical protein
VSSKYTYRALAVSLFLLLGGSATVSAQDVTEVALKGAFIFNFARFTEWPADALSSSTTVSACVVGDRGVSDALTKIVSGRKIDGRPVSVSFVEAAGAVPVCHLLYVSGVTRDRVVQIVSALRETPVLTVSDTDGFARLGGIVQVFVENGKMRFRINPRTAKRARLHLSSRLLMLADVVDVDVPQPVFASPPSRSEAIVK